MPVETPKGPRYDRTLRVTSTDPALPGGKPSGSGADTQRVHIDARDPLGLGDFALAPTPAPAAEPPASSVEATASTPDLSVLADMARRVEAARFAAERQLHNALRHRPTVAPPAASRASIDPVVRRMAAQADGATVQPEVLPPPPDPANRYATAPVPSHPAPAAEPPQSPMPPPHPVGHAISVAAASAALRELLSDSGVVQEAPAPSEPAAAEPVQPVTPPPPPIRLDRSPAERTSGGGVSDTASLLRELASLSGTEVPAPGADASPPPAAAPPRAPQRPTPTQSPMSRPRRKGLFAR